MMMIFQASLIQIQKEKIKLVKMISIKQKMKKMIFNLIRSIKRKQLFQESITFKIE